jgi:hypothetical protein
MEMNDLIQAAVALPPRKEDRRVGGAGVESVQRRKLS